MLGEINEWKFKHYLLLFVFVLFDKFGSTLFSVLSINKPNLKDSKVAHPVFDRLYLVLLVKPLVRPLLCGNGYLCAQVTWR